MIRGGIRRTLAAAIAGYQTRLRKFVSETGPPFESVNTMAPCTRHSISTDMPSSVRGGHRHHAV